MRKFAAVFGLVFLFGQANAGLIYALKSTERALYSIDSDNLESPSFIGLIVSAGDLAGLVDAGLGLIYTVDRSSDLLLTLSTEDASIVSSVSLGLNMLSHPRGYALAPDGTFYVIGRDGINTTLYEIDVTTGNPTTVTAINGAGGIEALAFSDAGVLYALGSPTSETRSTHLYELDIATGVLSLVSELIGLVALVPGEPDLDSLTFATDGFLYAADSQSGVDADLYRIDPFSGAVSNLGKTGVSGLNGLAAQTIAVPEPSTLGLLGVGLFGLLMRRKSIVVPEPSASAYSFWPYSHSS